MPSLLTVNEYDEINRRFTQAKTEKDNWTWFMQRLSRLAMPTQSDFWGRDKLHAYNKWSHIHDNYLSKQLQKKANEIIQDIIPAGEQWINIEPGRLNPATLSPEQLYQHNVALDDMSKYLLEQIDRSNFRQIMRMQALYMLTFGFASVHPTYDFINDRLHFRLWTATRVWLEKGYDNPDVGVFYQSKMNGRDYRNTYKIKQSVNYAIQDDEMIVINNALIPAGNQSIYYVWRDGDHEKKFLAKQLMEGRPVVVSKLIAEEGETYPLNSALATTHLADAETLNFYSQKMKENLALITTPPLLIKNTAFVNAGSLNLSPGGTNPVTDVDKAMAPVFTGRDNSGLFQAIEDLRGKIREGIDVVPTLADADRPKRESATAWDATLQNLGKATLEWSDVWRDLFLKPVLQQTIRILQRVPGSSIPPQINVDGKNYKIVISGSEEKKRHLRELGELQAAWEIVSGSQMRPVIFNEEKFIRMALEKINKTAILHSPEQTAAAREAMEEELARQQQQEEPQSV